MASDSDEIPPGGVALAGRILALVLFAAVLLAPREAQSELSPAAQRLAAVTVAMAVLWVTQALPIAATSLIPLAAFPLLGIAPAREVSRSYINENVFLYLGGFIIALGIEKWGLHTRMALHIVRVLGTSLRRVVLGFMLATAFLSMWISNTATTLLMLPLAVALLASLRDLSAGAATAAEEEARREAALRALGTALLIGVAYAASIGGFTTLIGTPTNVAFLGIYETLFPDGPEPSAGQWMVAVAPVGLVYLLLAWGLLAWRLPAVPGLRSLRREFFTQRLRALGRPRRAEWLMLAVFVATALLWVFREPLRFGSEETLPGWGPLVTRALVAWGVDPQRAAGAVDDSTVAMAMALLMFALPARRDPTGGRTEYLMDWRTAERLPWGILLLFGGGFALADAFKQTGLSAWLGEWFAAGVHDWPPWLLVGAVCLLLTFLTELTSNVATASAVLPVLARMSVQVGLDPRLVMIPATLATSCAFMLPIATPPNAIVFGSGRVRMGDMVRRGFFLNLIGVVLLTAATFWLLVPQLGIALDRLPEWAAPPPP